jgi:glycosyltransferase involved in cell wall biosynthesis
MSDSHFVVIRNAAEVGWPTDQLRAESVKERHGLDRYCLFVGSLVERKCLDILLRALTEVDMPCIIVGDGPMRPSLMRLANRMGIADRVVFTGALERHELRHYYADAEALVLPSVSEGVPLVAIEAFGAGIPVIASNLEGVASIVHDLKNGLLVKPRDVGSLVRALSVIDSDEIMRANLRSGARGSRDNLRDWSDVATQLCKLYANRRSECDVFPRNSELSQASSTATEDLIFGWSSTCRTTQPEQTTHA